MKFDVVIGNPPYQENDNGVREDGSRNASASPVYNKFIEKAWKINPHITSFIIPSRWLFGAGKGITSFREKMMSDKHIQSVDLYINSKEIFTNNDIKGGVLYFSRNLTHNGPAKITLHSGKNVDESERYLDSTGDGTFIQFTELQSILDKVCKKHPNLLRENIQKEISVLKPYGLRTDIFRDPTKYGLPPIQDSRLREDDLEIWGLSGMKRTLKYLPKNYPIPIKDDSIGKWKVFLPYAYGCGALGEEIPSPILGSPIQICSETFLRFGKWSSREEAEAAMKYLKTRFFRVLVGILKITQHSTTTFRYVPLQDFTNKSDIDWTKSIPEIDQQLFAKYKLSPDEITFIEEKVKEMK